MVKELAGNKAAAIGATSHHPADKRDDYVRWSTTTQSRLESVLRRKDAQSLFDTSRHHVICSMPPGNQLIPLIYAELDARATALGEAAAHIEHHLDRLRRAPGLAIVADTNVWLHCQRLDYVNWMAELKEHARVMIPLRVIEEIDAKKYDRDQILQRRARSLLPWLNSFFSGRRPRTGPAPKRRDGNTRTAPIGAPKSL